MGQQPLTYLHQTQWVNEGSIWRPPDQIILRDEAGTVIGSTAMTTMHLTLYDLTNPAKPFVGSLYHVDIKNTRSCTINSLGVFVLTLLPQDTIILNDANAYELRRAIIQYTWASGAKSDALEITFAVRNLHYHTGAAVSTMLVTDTATVTLVS